MKNDRNAAAEYRYTMNAFMGLDRVERGGARLFLDVHSDYERIARRLGEHSGSVENIAVTVWAGKCLAAKVPLAATTLFDNMLQSLPRLKHVTAQGVSWTIAACIASGDEYRERAVEIAKFAAERYIDSGSALSRHVTKGPRRNFSSFAASCYMAYALLLLSRHTRRTDSLNLGLKVARKLVELQGADGQWGWFYEVPGGRVVDYYPVYSVHQHAMAPLFLLEAIDQGYREFEQPLEKGFRWVLGGNELGLSLVSKAHGVVWRSVFRKGRFGKIARLVRGFRTRRLGLQNGIASREALDVNHECRSYELGWALWAFAGRQDFSQILDSTEFD